MRRKDVGVKTGVGFFIAWVVMSVISILLSLAFLGVVIWAIVELVLWVTSK